MGLFKKDSFFWWGCFSAFLVALDISVNLGDWTELFWFCPVAATVTAIAFFRKSSLLFTICLVLAIPAQLPWVFDFILYFFNGGMGRTDWLARSGAFIFWGSAVVHSAVIPLAAWGVWRLGFHRGALFPAMLSGFLLLMVSFFFTPISRNVNCVFFSCDDMGCGPNFLIYFLVGCLLRWALIVPVSFWILRWLFRNVSRKECADANSP